MGYGGQMRTFLAALMCMAVAANAQEGFPLDGTWRAEVASAKTPTTIVLIMQWDGSQVSGTINPGPEGIDFTDAKLTPEGWKVSISAKDAKGAPVVFEGAISDLGKYARVLAGKFTAAGVTHDVRFVRE